MTKPDIAWIADFWASIKPYIILRDEDDVLILPPNRVYKLNRTAANIIHWLSAGRCIEEIPDLNEEKIRQIEDFFKNMDLATRDKPHEAERIPYTFDYAKLPILGEIAVTYRCNNRCRFCYAGCDGAKGRMDSKDLPTEELKKVIKIFQRDAKIPFFSFTGGEPLVRKDLEELMAYATELGLRINLVSNGTLATPERARSLYEAGLRTAQISLESPNAETHNYLCNREDAFEKTVEGIKNLIAAGIHVQTNSTSLTRNIDELPDLPAFVYELGVRRMSINLFIPTVRSPQIEGLFVPYSKIGKTVDAVSRAARKAGVEFLWYSPTPICIFNPIARGLGNKSCAACDGLISIDPEGNVLPCSSWDEPVGNILKLGFHDVWFNNRAQAIKNKCFAHKTCQSCSAFTACQGACPLYWQYAGYEELEKYAPPFIERNKLAMECGKANKGKA